MSIFPEHEWDNTKDRHQVAYEHRALNIRIAINYIKQLSDVEVLDGQQTLFLDAMGTDVPIASAEIKEAVTYIMTWINNCVPRPIIARFWEVNSKGWPGYRAPDGELRLFDKHRLSFDEPGVADVTDLEIWMVVEGIRDGLLETVLKAVQTEADYYNNGVSLLSSALEE